MENPLEKSVSCVSGFLALDKTAGGGARVVGGAAGGGKEKICKKYRFAVLLGQRNTVLH